MRFSCAQLKFLTQSHVRVLVAVEMGSKNHEVVPRDLISKISKTSCNLDSTITDLVRQDLLKRGHDAPYEGYSLTYTGYDNLALSALCKQGVLCAVGSVIGVGKESDVYLGETPGGRVVVVKIHRLGRTCFKAVKRSRSYHGPRRHASWMYLSRISAEREYELMGKLEAIPIPAPIAANRHIVVMEYLSNYTPLYKIVKLHNREAIKLALLEILERLREQGWAHGDYNEFNIMVRNDFKKVKIIDFPQMVRVEDERAEEYLARDRGAIERYFAAAQL